MMMMHGSEMTILAWMLLLLLLLAMGMATRLLARYKRSGRFVLCLLHFIGQQRWATDTI